jgi:GTP1/Obg family GTP-binding protein
VSNARRGAVRNTYRTGYLRSPAWFNRRDRWFRTEQRRGPLTCVACGRAGTRRTLELHHLSYRGVRVLDGRWLATEKHDDLTALHPFCHELVHRLIDRDRILARSRTHRDATSIAIRQLQAIIARREVQR